jgi:hypothetical protein
MKKMLLCAILLSSFVQTASAQSTSHTWIDITASPYFAINDCTADAGTAINSAISSAPAGSGVIFFPAGCYLIKTQIVDTNVAAHLTYLGEGQVELRASVSTPPGRSMIKFGENEPTPTVVPLRKIVGIDFNCNGAPIDGIEAFGLSNSEFDGITVRGCLGTQVVAGTHTYNNTFLGGLIDASGTYSNGVNLEGCSSSVAWSFFGTKILGSESGIGVGLELDGSGSTFQGGVVAGFELGIAIDLGGGCGSQGGFAISGAFIENNSYAGIQVGHAGYGPNFTPSGVTITGNYFNCSNGKYGIDLQSVNGFTVTSNRFDNCASFAVRGLADSSFQGADNGIFGANFVYSGQPISLEGSNNLVTPSTATKSSAYTLTGTDTWVNVTGNTTITVPHAISGQRWDIFNSGAGTLTLICDSGTINGGTSLAVFSQTGKSVTTDGTSCFAH